MSRRLSGFVVTVTWSMMEPLPEMHTDKLNLDGLFQSNVRQLEMSR